MKKVLVLVLVMMMALSSFVLAKDRPVLKVEVTDIDSPFEKTRVLDTTGKVPNKATYRISKIEWNQIETSKYEVTVTLIPNIGYYFSGDIDATINGNAVTSQEIVDDDEFKISYYFTEKSETNISNETLKHRIIAYYDTNKGVISPNGYRVLNGYDQTFKIIPNEGYKVKEVIVDGQNLGEMEEYTFKRVTKSHEIRAFFEKVGDEEEIENEVVSPIQDTSTKPLLQLLLDLISLFKM